MRYLIIIPYYFSWHYTKGFKELITNTKNFVIFVPHLFSMKTLISTLFSPFQRIKETSTGGFDPEGFLGNIVVNLIMRVVGLLVRTVILAIGIVSLVFVASIGLAFLLVWALLPVLLVGVFIASLLSLFGT